MTLLFLTYALVISVSLGGERVQSLPPSSFTGTIEYRLVVDNSPTAHFEVSKQSDDYVLFFGQDVLIQHMLEQDTSEVAKSYYMARLNGYGAYMVWPHAQALSAIELCGPVAPRQLQDCPRAYIEEDTTKVILSRECIGYRLEIPAMHNVGATSVITWVSKDMTIDSRFAKLVAGPGICDIPFDFEETGWMVLGRDVYARGSLWKSVEAVYISNQLELERYGVPAREQEVLSTYQELPATAHDSLWYDWRERYMARYFDFGR